MSETPTPAHFDDRARRELLRQRVLVLDGVLDDDNGTLLTTQLMSLPAEDPTTDIALWIHSPGGSVTAILAIRDVMRLVPNDVSTLALGIACSAGQFLLSAGTKGKRRALPHSRVLLHQGSAGIGGTASTSSCRRTTCGTPATRSSGSSARTRGSRSSASSRSRCGTGGSPPGRRSTSASSTRSSAASTTSHRAVARRPGSGVAS